MRLRRMVTGGKKTRLQNDRIIVYLPGATTEVATLKQALTKAEDKAAKERTEREKQEARVGEGGGMWWPPGHLAHPSLVLLSLGALLGRYILSLG